MDIEYIRALRKSLCFSVINRGKLWYDSLTQEQLTELTAWYNEWLDAPKHGTIPQTPDWIFPKE